MPIETKLNIQLLLVQSSSVRVALGTNAARVVGDGDLAHVTELTVDHLHRWLSRWSISWFWCLIRRRCVRGGWGRVGG